VLTVRAENGPGGGDVGELPHACAVLRPWECLIRRSRPAVRFPRRPGQNYRSHRALTECNVPARHYAPTLPWDQEMQRITLPRVQRYSKLKALFGDNTPREASPRLAVAAGIAARRHDWRGPRLWPERKIPRASPARLPACPHAPARGTRRRHRVAFREMRGSARGPAGLGRSARGPGVCRVFAGRRPKAWAEDRTVRCCRGARTASTPGGTAAS